MESLEFPAGFVWGVATSSHQVEGENRLNQWFDWERRGRIASGEVSGLACDWWRNAEKDFDRIREMGLNGLRLSLEWSRIEPEPGRWDEQALARYRQMLAALRDRGIEPMVTLHHFTHPLWLERQGGFTSPRVIPLFERYARRCVETLGDLCDLWCTVNEPNVYALASYVVGAYAPGGRYAFADAARALGNMLRSHASAYRAIHALQPDARVGLAHHIYLFDPANPHRRLDRWVAAFQDVAFHGLIEGALLRGAADGPLGPFAGDLRAVRGAFDYLGLNYYTRSLVAFDPWRPFDCFSRRFSSPGATCMDGGAGGAVGQTYGEIYTDGLRRALLRLTAFRCPLYVTEHGVADARDVYRPAVLVQAAEALHAALQAGVPVRGYYHWTLLDNFEWAEGWTPRFGLIAFDPRTQERRPRPSADIYSRIARSNGVPPELRARFSNRDAVAAPGAAASASPRSTRSEGRAAP